MRRYKTIIMILTVLLCLYPFTSCTPPGPDYNLYENMRQYLQQKFDEMGAELRSITEDFDDYIITLNPLFALIFGNLHLEVHVYSYESGSMAAASISQFEVPPDSSNFTDIAFLIRPNANLKAPLLHGDALKEMAGMHGSFSMDFYNLNEDIDIDDFFGDQIEKLNEALEIVADYQRTGEDRGEWTPHLDPYKSKYRIEIEEPQTTDEEEREAYFDAALEAFQLFMDAYSNSLAQLEPEDDENLIQNTKDGTDEFIQTLLENDFAAKMGRVMFGDDFENYFLDAMWRDGYYGEGI